MNPEKILKQLNLRKDMEVADFGSGHGYFSIPLAKIVSDGRVYALDVIEEALDSIKSRAKLEGISNITVIRRNLELPEGSKLDDESVDLVVLANILYQSQKKEEILEEAKRVLKKGERLVIIEWIKGSSLAPKKGWLISKEEARHLAEDQGLNFEMELQMDGQHYGLVFKK